MKIIMSPHNGCYNHGCEAIVRSTTEILGLPKEKLLLYSSDTDNDIKYGLDKVCTLVQNNSGNINLSFPRKKWFALKEKIFSADRDLEEISYKHRSAIAYKKDLVALSIGGDNYCYNGMQHILNESMKLFTYNNISSILWGCSIEKNMLNENAINDLKKYSLITVRESLSYKSLVDIGVDEKRIIKCSDPAFILKAQSIDLYHDFLGADNVIGINISDLMKHYNAYPDATYRNFYNLIQYIIENTNCNIVMIPHVIHDRMPIKKLASQFPSERIFCVNEDFNCMQLKYIISKCKMFVGCRTHSTIAAYSTCVPTLVVGYSVKARGICRDIFGTYEDLLIDARKFETDDDLTNKFIAFSKREDELRNHLKKIMPGYIQRAYNAKQAVLDLI